MRRYKPPPERSGKPLEERLRDAVREPPSRQAQGVAFDNWGHQDEKAMARRRRAYRNRAITLTAFAVVFFCSFISMLLGVPQSYAAQAMVTLPKYPNAQRISFRDGLDCPVTLGVYCYNSTYRTSDSPQQVVVYYQQMSRPSFLPPVKFVAESNQRFFGDYVNASVCASFIGHRSCTEIAVIAKDTGTEINYFEIGYPGETPPKDEGQ